MSNYDTHKFLGFLPLPLVVVLILIAYDGDLAEMLPFVGFLAWWVLHTVAITPDLDIYSIPSKRMGPIGWAARTFTTHREGIFHSGIFWAFYFILQYHFIGWWTLGGVFPIFCHLYTDIITSWLNRLKIVKLIKKSYKLLKKLF
jgi:uncharacterized metal-binding protein